MRPDVLIGPSPWMVEQFGDKVAVELWTRVPEALSTAIDREVHARPATAQTAERVLANPRWPLPYEELVLFLGTLPGAEIISVPKSVYQLVVINGHVVVPWCYGQSARMSMRDAEVGRSFGRLTRELLRRFGPPWRRSQAEPGLPGRRTSVCCAPASARSSPPTTAPSTGVTSTTCPCRHLSSRGRAACSFPEPTKWPPAVPLGRRRRLSVRRGTAAATRR
jgi:hypothetical protein